MSSRWQRFKDFGGDDPYWFWKSIFGIIIYVAVGAGLIAFTVYLTPHPKPCFETVAVCVWENEQLVCRSWLRSCQ